MLHDLEDQRAHLERLEQKRALQVATYSGRKPWIAESYQLPPDGDWYLWILMAGRGAGKSSSCAAYFDRWMRENPGARGGIIGPTIGDVAESCIYGPWGLLAHNPRVRVRSRFGGTRIEWPNGSESLVFGAHSRNDIERLRGSGANRWIFWLEELAAWRYLRETWEIMEPALRDGPRPHVIASTTPKPRPFLKSLMEARDTVITRASTFDNPHLPEEQRERWRRRYAGTRWERQELHGEYIEDVEGALWTFEMVANTRVTNDLVPDLTKVVVGVDPSGGDEEGNDEQGIVVVGKGVDGHGYVLADRSCKLSPDGWGKRAVQAYLDLSADKIVGETNYGGDMVVQTIRVAARDLDQEVNVQKITASRGKVARAEPVAALYEQGRFHHVGEFAELESQMRDWTPDSGWSPDRMDALVWAATETMLKGNETGRMVSRVPRGRIDIPQPGMTYIPGVGQL